MEKRIGSGGKIEHSRNKTKPSIPGLSALVFQLWCKCKSTGHHLQGRKKKKKASLRSEWLWTQEYTCILKPEHTHCSISVPIHPCVTHCLQGNSRQPTPPFSLRAAYLPRTGFPLYPKYSKHLLCTNPLQDGTVSRPHFSQHFIATFLLKNLVRFIPFIQNSVVPLPASSVSKTKVTHNCIWKQAMKLLGSACLPATLADLNSPYNDLLFSK